MSANAGEYAIRAKCVYPATANEPGPIYDGVIHVRDGKIVAVGRSLDIPPNVPMIDRPDAVICPGFVMAGSSLAGSHASSESVSGAFRAIDNFDTYADHSIDLANGITTVHLDPGQHRFVSGIGAVVKLAGAPSDRTLRDRADLNINFGAFNAPPVVDVPFFASADEAIEPAELQRPESRLGQMQMLRNLITAAGSAPTRTPFDFHRATFAAAWRDELPLRLEINSAADLANALKLLEAEGRKAYFVGGREAFEIADQLAAAGYPFVLRLDRSYERPGANIGPDPAATGDQTTRAATLQSAGLAAISVAGRTDESHPNPGMLAALARRSGLTANQTLAALTRIPAETLGVADRVGSLKPGADADFVVMTGAPTEISSRVLETFVNGRRVFDVAKLAEKQTNATVVRAKTIWLSDGTTITDGELLLRDGKIAAVGQRVAAPRGASIIDASRDGFVTPGFIDAHGHLGLQGDQTSATPDLPIHQIVGVANREFIRVAAAGVTTVMLAPYKVAKDGGRIAAIKTFGLGPSELVARPIAGIKINFAGRTDPLTGVDAIRGKLAAAKKYAESWKKYEEALAKWKADKAAGKETKPVEVVDEVVEDEKEDPITGTWSFKLSGGPLPEEVEGTMRLRLNGNQIEGRAEVALADDETVLTGTLDGKNVVLELDQETPMGKPRFEATLDKPDHMTGVLKLGEQFSIDFNADRTSKEQVEFKVSRRKRKSEDGRPIAPKVNEGLEPYREVLAGRAPLVVQVSTAAQIAAIVDLIAVEQKLPLILMNAGQADAVHDKLAKHKDKLGIIVPPQVTQVRRRVTYNPAAEFALAGIPIALQSNAEDAARDLPLTALFSVQQGLGGDAALRALTIEAAKMYKLDDRIGALEVGKDADVLIFDGHPFDAGTSLQRVIVNGHEVPRTPAKG